MEAKHRSRILGEFRNALGNTHMHVLEIPYDYQYMDPELVQLLTDRVEEYLQTLFSGFDADQ